MSKYLCHSTWPVSSLKAMPRGMDPPTADLALGHTLAGDVAGPTWPLPCQHPRWRHIFIGWPRGSLMSRHVSWQFYATWQPIHYISFHHRTWKFSSWKQRPYHHKMFTKNVTVFSSFITKVHRPWHITDHRTCQLPSSTQITEVHHISSTHHHWSKVHRATQLT